MDDFWGEFVKGIASGVGKEALSLVVGHLKQSVDSSKRLGTSSRREELERLGLILDKIEKPEQLQAQAEEIDSLIANVSAENSKVREKFDFAKKKIQKLTQRNRYGQNIGVVKGDLHIHQHIEARDELKVKKGSKSVRINNAPPHNTHFTGREDLLTALREKLLKGGTTALTALNGMGGIGKTQVAIEYCHRYSKEYDVVWWVEAENDTVLRTQFGKLGHKLGLVSETIEKEEILHEAVIEWLRNPPQNARWLMVFDNAEREEQLTSFVGHGNGHVVITSRNPYWGSKGLEVNKMVESEAIDFLIERTGLQDRVGAKQVAKELDYLPLALEQAAAYILKRNLTFAKYLEQYRETGVRLFEHEKANVDPTRYSKSVLTTWELSIQAAKEKCDLAEGALNFLAFVAPEDIPLDLLGVKDIAEYDEALDALRDFSLIRYSGNSSISLHRLVQDVTRDRMTDTERSEVLKSAIESVSKFPKDIQTNVAKWGDCSRLLPHALAISEHARKLQGESSELADLLNDVGMYLLVVRASYGEVKTVFEWAIKIAETTRSGKDAVGATYLNNLGNAHHGLGDYEGAKYIFEQALKIDVAVFGPESPEVATDVNNLGTVLLSMRDYAGAKEMFELALGIFEKEFGEIDANVAGLVNNLGEALRAMGNYTDAKEMYERALSIDERVFAFNHPNVARDVNNLGLVLHAQGDFVNAKKNWERALSILRGVGLSETHPWIQSTTESLKGLLAKHPELRDE